MTVVAQQLLKDWTAFVHRACRERRRQAEQYARSVHEAQENPEVPLMDVLRKHGVTHHTPVAEMLRIVDLCARRGDAYAQQAREQLHEEWRHYIFQLRSDEAVRRRWLSRIERDAHHATAETTKVFRHVTLANMCSADNILWNTPGRGFVHVPAMLDRLSMLFGTFRRQRPAPALDDPDVGVSLALRTRQLQEVRDKSIGCVQQVAALHKQAQEEHAQARVEFQDRQRRVRCATWLERLQTLRHNADSVKRQLESNDEAILRYTQESADRMRTELVHLRDTLAADHKQSAALLATEQKRYNSEVARYAFSHQGQSTELRAHRCAIATHAYVEQVRVLVQSELEYMRDELASSCQLVIDDAQPKPPPGQPANRYTFCLTSLRPMDDSIREELGHLAALIPDAPVAAQAEVQREIDECRAADVSAFMLGVLSVKHAEATNLETLAVSMLSWFDRMLSGDRIIRDSATAHHTSRGRAFLAQPIVIEDTAAPLFERITIKEFVEGYTTFITIAVQPELERMEKAAAAPHFTLPMPAPDIPFTTEWEPVGWADWKQTLAQSPPPRSVEAQLWRARLVGILGMYRVTMAVAVEATRLYLALVLVQ